MKEIFEGAWPFRLSAADTVLLEHGGDLVPFDAANTPNALQRIRRELGL